MRDSKSTAPIFFFATACLLACLLALLGEFVVGGAWRLESRTLRGWEGWVKFVDDAELAERMREYFYHCTASGANVMRIRRTTQYIGQLQDHIQGLSWHTLIPMLLPLGLALN